MALHLATTAAVCLVVGWLAGAAWTRAARGWSDWKTQRSQVAALFALARTLSIHAAAHVIVAVTVAAYAVYTIATER